jgi:hypothetical protein
MTAVLPEPVLGSSGLVGRTLAVRVPTTRARRHRRCRERRVGVGTVTTDHPVDSFREFVRDR